jgi:CubicO group peptidase (beta-lactamase class C family)
VVHGPPPHVGPLKGLNVDKFGERLKQLLRGNVAGYALQLRRGGSPVWTQVYGVSQGPSDGNIAWTAGTRQHVGSVSKVITAMALMKVLDDHHVEVGTPIASYLPKYWPKGPGVDKITFRDLLLHTSGLNPGVSASDYELMKRQIGYGPSDYGKYHYQNMNYGLCRILISVINGNVGADWLPYGPVTLPNILIGTDTAWDYATIQAYAQYAQDKVFTPSGVTDASLVHDKDTAFAYDTTTQGGLKGPGWDSGDLSTMAGGAGWHLSPVDLLKVMGTFRRGGGIFTRQRARALLDAGFGTDIQATFAEGTIYGKGGLWTDGTPDSSGHEEQAAVFFLPEDMELAVVVNSRVGGGIPLELRVRDMYVQSLE